MKTCACTVTTDLFSLCPPCRQKAWQGAEDERVREKYNPRLKGKTYKEIWNGEHVEQVWTK